MREPEFRAYLDPIIEAEHAANKQHNIDEIVRKVKKAEIQLGVNLDTEGKIGRQTIYASLEPTSATKENRHPNQNTMDFQVATAEGTPHSIRSAIKHYRRFCKDPDIG